jgi:hypothetical protein
MKEIEKYKIIYTNNDEYHGYGHGSHGFKALPFIKKMTPS